MHVCCKFVIKPTQKIKYASAIVFSTGIIKMDSKVYKKSHNLITGRLDADDATKLT